MTTRAIKVKGEKLSFLAHADSSEILLTGATTGETPTGWNFKVKGTYLHWTDNDGAERRALGAATGNTGLPGIIKVKGAKHYYNDQLGDERFLPGTATILGTGSEGYVIIGNQASWDLAHDAASGSGSTTNSVSASTSHDRFPWVGGDDDWDCARGFLYFDTSPYSGMSVATAKIRVFVFNKAVYDVGDADLHIVEGVQDDPFELSDFGDHLLKVVSLGSIAYGDIVDDAWNEITLNATGIGLLNLVGISKFCVKVSGDINDNAPSIDGPSTGNRVSFRSSHTADFEPQLILTFS